MRPLSVFLSLLLLAMPVLTATDPDSDQGSSAEGDWTLTLVLVGAVAVGLLLLAILTPESTSEEVVVSEPGKDDSVDEKALEAAEASRKAEEEDPLFREIEGD
ncbi:MAG TPA: hypothetical protein ENN88_00580 [Candidatus Coatesbacteria bacterium]|nr:hypothetical protein [Candidatus Coatesbacteria bacterium]